MSDYTEVTITVHAPVSGLRTRVNALGLEAAADNVQDIFTGEINHLFGERETQFLASLRDAAKNPDTYDYTQHYAVLVVITYPQHTDVTVPKVHVLDSAGNWS